MVRTVMLMVVTMSLVMTFVIVRIIYLFVKIVYHNNLYILIQIIIINIIHEIIAGTQMS